MTQSPVRRSPEESQATGPFLSWRFPPAGIKLDENEVHIWRATLTVPSGRLSHLATTLCEDERVRAARFRFERDSKYFIAGRGILRSILGRYLSIEPGQVRFEYAPGGKPRD